MPEVSRRHGVDNGMPRASRISLSAHRSKQVPHRTVSCRSAARHRLFDLGPPLANLRFYAGHPSRFHYFGLKEAAAAELTAAALLARATE
jgi:hypothetical protein